MCDALSYTKPFSKFPKASGINLLVSWLGHVEA